MREKEERSSGLDVPSPTEAIIAFAGFGCNQIFRSKKNKWEKWYGRDCGTDYAFVRVEKNIFIIGGGGIIFDSLSTNIYNIETETWSEGPKLKNFRLDEYSLFSLNVSLKGLKNEPILKQIIQFLCCCV